MKRAAFAVFAIIIQSVAVLCQSVYSQSFCVTRYRSRFHETVSTKTRTRTFSSTRTILVTTTPSTTITPLTITATTTSTLQTTTTEPAVTDTVPTTLTSTDITVVTSSTTVATVTTTTTTTTLTATVSTVPVPNGFKYPSPTPAGAKERLMRFGKRELETKRLLERAKPSRVSQFRRDDLRSTSTTTASSVTTFTAETPSVTSTETTTSLEMTTSPKSTTTVTQTSSTTSTNTVVETTTSTNTATSTSTSTPPPSSTVYAACQGKNIASTDYMGRSLELEAAYVESRLSNTPTAYDCCVLCFQTPNCYGSNWGSGFVNNNCELEVGNTCPSGQAGRAGLYSYLRPGNIPVSISNGPCGTYAYSETI